MTTGHQPIHMKVGATHSPPFSILVKDSLGNITNITGLGGDYFKLISSLANFTYTVVEPKDNAWGVMLPNGTFTGILGMLSRNEADLSVVLSPRRKEPVGNIEYSTCVSHHISSISPRKETKTTTEDILNTISKKLFWDVSLLFMLSLCLLRIASLISEMVIVTKKSAQRCTSLLRTFWDYTDFQTLSARMFALIHELILLIAICIVGSLISTDLTVNVSTQFDTLQQLADSKSMKAGFFKGYVITNMFGRNPDPLYKRIWESSSEILVLENFLSNQDHLTEKIAKGTGSIINLKGFEETTVASAICRQYPYLQLHISKEEFLPVCLAIPMRRSLEPRIRKRINHAVSIALQAAHYQVLSGKIYRVASCVDPDTSNDISDPEPLPLLSLSTVFIGYGCLHILSAIFLFAKWLVYEFLKR